MAMHSCAPSTAKSDQLVLFEHLPDGVDQAKLLKRMYRENVIRSHVMDFLMPGQFE